jgi:hypothetical protein
MTNDVDPGSILTEWLNLSEIQPLTVGGDYFIASALNTLNT